MTTTAITDLSAPERAERALGFLTLLATSGTLVCCVLPAIFVSLGAGAAFASLLSAVPQLIWFSENKGVVFGVAGLLLFGSAIVRRLSQRRACPTDPLLAASCGITRRRTDRGWWISLALFVLGAFFAFVLPRLTVAGQG